MGKFMNSKHFKFKQHDKVKLISHKYASECIPEGSYLCIVEVWDKEYYEVDPVDILDVETFSVKGEEIELLE
jgi:hypothetical protein